MEHWICTTCGTQFVESETEPEDAKNAVLRSADRYIRALERPLR